MPPDTRTTRLAQGATVGLACAFAIWTVLAQLLLLTGGSLDALIAVAALAFLGAAALRIRHGARDARARAVPDPAVGLGLAVLCALGAGVALLACLPNGDDVIYASRAVYFLEHPGVPLDLEYHDLAFADFSTAYPLTLAYTLELLWAALSRVTPLSFLHVYHGVAPAVGGLLIPLGWFVLVSRFTSRSAHALLGAAAITAYLWVDGSTFNTFGSYAFLRIWQGKALLLSVGVPVFVAFSLDWLRRPGRDTWLRLFVVSVAASGFTSTALFLLPGLAGLLGAATLLAGGVDRRSLRRVIGYGAALAYPAAVAVIVRLSMARADFSYIGEAFFPGDYLGQVGLLVGPVPLTAIAFVGATGGALALAPPAERRFLGGWLLTAFVLLLNPVVTPFVIEYLTTANGYWRLFYTLPFPLMLGLFAAWLAQRRRAGDRAALSAAGSLLVLTGVLNLALPGATALGGQRFALGPKLHPLLQMEVEAIVAKATPGPMLAPIPASSVVPLYTSRLPQVVVRGLLLVHFSELAGRPGLAKRRIRAVRYVWHGDAPGRAPEVERMLQRGVRNVVFDRRAGTHAALQPRLESLGFQLTHAGPRFLMFSRAPTQRFGA